MSLKELLLLKIQDVGQEVIGEQQKEAFKRLNITIIAQLLFIHPKILLAHPNIGRKTLINLNAALNAALWEQHHAAEVGALAENDDLAEIKTAILGNPEEPNEAATKQLQEPRAQLRLRQTATEEDARRAAEEFMPQILKALENLVKPEPERPNGMGEGP